MKEKLIEYFNGDELAAYVVKSKYFTEKEKVPDEMHRRMAGEFAKIEDKYRQGYTNDSGIEMESEHSLKTFYGEELSEYGQNREDLTEDSIYELFKDFKYIVPQGSVMATLGTDIVASLSNCFVVESPADSYGGILKADSDLASYFKRRGGVGMDISHLRPDGSATNNTAKTSTGAVSFMERFSNTCREVAMAGRRGRA